MFWIIKALFGKCADPNIGPQTGSKQRLRRLRERKPEPDQKDQMTTGKNVQQILEQHIANEKRSTLDGISKWQMGRGQANRVPAAFGNAFITPAKGVGFHFQENPMAEERMPSQNPYIEGLAQITRASDLDQNRREMVRQELHKRGQIARSLTMLDEPPKETLFADDWNCRESLFTKEESNSANEKEGAETLTQEFRGFISPACPAICQDEPGTTNSGIKSADKSATQANKTKDEIRLPAQNQNFTNFSEHALKLIAQSHSTPASTLAWLATHENPHIRAAIAKNPNTPTDTIWLLASDPEAGIRYSLAESATTTALVLRELTQDRNLLIGWIAHNTLEKIMNNEALNSSAGNKVVSPRSTVNDLLARDPRKDIKSDVEFLQIIAGKESTPVRRLRELSLHESAKVRAVIAENANTPLDVMWILARDPDPNVKIKLSENYNCPFEILEVLKEDKDAYVALQAQQVLTRLVGVNYTSAALDQSRSDIKTHLTWP
jgi:hypothetical protein